jgi:hypothetical protein
MRRLLVAVLVFAAACANGGAQLEPSAQRVVASPEPTARVDVSVDLPKVDPTLPATPRRTVPPLRLDIASTPTPRPPAPAPAAAVATGLSAFTGLGSWIDVFDYNDGEHPLPPLVRSMAKRGVRTLYLETSRFTAADDIQFPKSLGAGLDEAKQLGMRVIAWYPPGLADVDREVRRSLAAVRFTSPEGNRFDGFGADIEYTEAVRDPAKRNQNAIAYSRKLRAAVGSAYPMGAIVIPPETLERDPARWPNFPWKELAKSYQLFMPMNYWTALGANPGTARDLTRYNVEKTRKLTGKPVHIIGGLGENAGPDQVAAYVEAAKESGSLGGGLYDYTTTRSDVWTELAKLNR